VIRALPALNAALNACTALLLVAGWLLVRRGRVATHARVMTTAFGLSVLFLVSYVTHHVARGRTHTRYAGPDAWRTLYHAVLLSHTVLAAAVAVLVPLTLRQALKARFDRHRRLARIAFPLWLYVAVTGPVIYVMLYHLGTVDRGGSMAP